VGQNVRNPRRGTGVVKKMFHAYLENYEQSAHDKTIATYCLSLKGATRSPHDSKVKPPNTNVKLPLVYYSTHGKEASKLAAACMQKHWTDALNAGKDSTVFTSGKAYSIAVQGKKQGNGFCYEITMWYDVADVYVAFHCYAP
jgi:hypothetical protein